MRLFQFRVSIVGVPKVYRIIDASENCTFEDLHEAIFSAFNRYDPHLYSFFITKSDTKNFRTIWSAPEITHPENTEDFMGFGEKKMSVAKIKIGDVGLAEKDVFHYLFDFGDDWWHRIRVQSIREGALRTKHKLIKVVKSVGASPPQYPDDDEYEDDEY
ncbi:plasmid pRiA4b ORF-3 family protein [Desulfosarcina sp.]|uniref:plasmid pRiA4b ORF-3 family protein n=1 Tax=Desulfosarcina sp. TaxID=2027861 RepID=UPI003568FEA4